MPQAKLLTTYRFGIEFAPEVVLADGNVRNLSWRVCNAKKVLVSNRWHYSRICLICTWLTIPGSGTLHVAISWQKYAYRVQILVLCLLSLSTFLILWCQQPTLVQKRVRYEKWHHGFVTENICSLKFIVHTHKSLVIKVTASNSEKKYDGNIHIRLLCDQICLLR